MNDKKNITTDEFYILFNSATSVKDDASFRDVTCISCDIGSHCTYVDASFTPTGRYYVLGCKGPDVPSYHLYSTESGLGKFGSTRQFIPFPNNTFLTVRK